MLEGIGPFPSNAGKRTVISLSSPTVHTVEIKSKGKELVCDDHCPRFKECVICPHTDNWLADALSRFHTGNHGQKFHSLAENLCLSVCPVPDGLFTVVIE